MTLLLLEDNLQLLGQLDKFFQKEFPDVLLLQGRLIDEAHSYASAMDDIKFAIIDTHLPDGLGIDFLCDLKIAHPDVKTILLTDKMMPGYMQRAAELDIVEVLEKPFPLEKLKAALSHLITPPVKKGFQALLSNITLLDILQIRCSSRVTQGLEIVSGDCWGRIYLRKGEIIYAEAGPDPDLCWFEEEAIRHILCWEVGKINELRGECPHLQNIYRPWQAILLDAVRHADEQRSQLLEKD